jgi:hypothetical protein
MVATHAVQRVNGPASVTREPLCGTCLSVVVSAAGAGRYTSCPWLMLRHIVPRRPRPGFLPWPTPCVAGYMAALGLNL